MDVFFRLGYYLTIFLIPFAFYSLFLKNCRRNKKFYTKRDWYYIVKWFFARASVKQYQQKCRQSLNETGEKSLENAKEIQSEQYHDSHFIYGVDQKGNSLSLRLTIKTDFIAEVYLTVRLGSTTYTLLDQSSTITRIVKWQWRTKSLHIDILEPLKRLRLTYNGNLRNINQNTIEHIQFNLIWNSGGAPKFYPQDASTSLLADAVALETWRDGDWMTLLFDERGYEQFGALKGFIRGDGFQDDIVLNLPSNRLRFWGTLETLAVERSIHLVVAGTDGTVINLWIKRLQNGCRNLKYGSVIGNYGQIDTIDDCDVGLDFLGQQEFVPNLFTIHVTVGKKQIKCIFHLEKNNTLVTETNGYKLISIPATCDLNVIQGRAILEMWYNVKDTASCELPPPLIRQVTTTVNSSSYIVTFDNDAARNVKLTGGKGCSLAMLSHLHSQDFLIPTGFIVNVNAFKRQLATNFNLKKAVEILDDICCGGTPGDLEQACAETVKAFKSEKIHPDILTQIQKHLHGNKRWAVRSSAVGEDGDELSAAGQNETFLGCKCTDVIDAIASCWASLFTYQSVTYRHQHGLAVQTEMAVVVQEMVAADCAGVLFTCHPTTANPAHLVITANHGLGESVVSGRSEPDTVIIDRTTMKITKKMAGAKARINTVTDDGTVEEIDNPLSEFSISDQQAVELANVGIVIEEAFGGCRDIEWAYHSGRLYLLQARPITTLEMWSDEELLHEFDVATFTDDMVYTVANVGEVLPGAITVLSMSTTVNAVDQAMQSNIHEVVDRHVLKCLQSFQHHVFIEVVNTIHKNPTDEITLTSKIMDLAVFGHPVIDDRINAIAIQRFGVKSAMALMKELGKMLKNAWHVDGLVARIKEKAAILHVDIDVVRDTIKDMYVKIDRYVEKMADVVSYHCAISTISVFYQIMALNILVERNADLTNDHYNDIALLLSSCDDVISAEIPAILNRIAQILNENHLMEAFVKIDATTGRDWLKTNCSQAAELFEKFLLDHGHRLLGEFELCKNSWAMAPEMVVKMIQANRNARNSLEKNVKSVDDVVSSLVSPKSQITRKILRFLLSRSRRAVGAREQAKSEVIRTVNKLRLAYRQLALKMAVAGLLPNQNLLYHLSHYEIGQIIDRSERAPVLINKALRRSRLYEKWDKMKFPELSYGFPRVERDDEIDVAGDGAVKCVGTTVCGGLVKARACVITNLEQIDQLHSGDILITYSTDIGWSPYFPMLAGIVTELGGLVSHGAVVAREYGLPSVVGVKGVTKMFKTGDIVVLSGKGGTIELVS